jgi:mediator of replication checkpoint protein 1
VSLQPPTKKELKETRRDSARLAADQPVSIPRNRSDTQKYTMDNFFTGLAGRTVAKEPLSDPIGEFSSPPKDALPFINQLLPAPISRFPGCETSAFLSMTGESPEPRLLKPMASLGDLDSGSDGLPEVGKLVSEELKKQEQAHTQHALLEKKKLLLAQQAAKRAVSDDDDDDLEIMPPKEISAVVKEEVGRKSGKKRTSEGRKRQLNLGGIGLEKQRVKETTSMDDAPPFSSYSVGRLKGTKNNVSITQGELNKSLFRRMMRVNEELTKKKEEEWVRRGGKVIDGTQDILSSANDASAAYAEKGLKVAEECRVAMKVDGDDKDGDGDSDEDWMPEMRGSASPSPQLDDGEEDDDEDNGDGGQAAEEADITMVNPENEGATVDDDFGEKHVLKVRPRRRVQAIVDSDDEGSGYPFSILKPRQRAFGSPQDDDNNENAMLPISISSTNYRGSLSSTDERTEDENDKENNTSLMFDHSENKENKAVVRHGDISGKHPLETRTGSLFGLELGIARGLSMSPVLHSQGIDADDEDESEATRSPLKDLLDDDPFQVPSSKLSASFTVRLQQTSPAAKLPPDANLAPFIGDDGRYPHSPTEPSGIGHELLQPGFSDLFESGTEKQKVIPFKRPAGLGLSESFSDEVRTKNAPLSRN